MNDASLQLSRTLESVSGPLAEWTVGLHLEHDPSLPERFGAAWRREWVGDVAARLQYLAQAVAMRRPALFGDAMRSARGAYEARGMSGDDLDRSLACLTEVVSGELPADAAAVIRPHLDEARAALEAPRVEPVIGLEAVSPTGRMALQYIEAALDGRTNEAQSLVLDAAQEGMSVPTIYESVLRPAQAALGTMWHAGEITVADEHAASACTQAVMARLRSHFERREPNGRTVLTTAVAGDLHDIGLRMVSDLFELDGWTACYLGANVPTSDVLQVVLDRSVDLLAVSVGTSLHLRPLGELIGAARALPRPKPLRVIVGGPPFAVCEDLWRDLGADACAASASDAVHAANALVSSAG